MIKKHFYFLMIGFLMSYSFISNAQLNLLQRSFLPFPGQKLAGVWHYVDAFNVEYALVGTETGLAIVDVSNPEAPILILQVPGIVSRWREVKTWGAFAYVTTKG